MRGLTRRDLLRAGALGLAGAGLPGLWRDSALALDDPGPILVVVELAGGNDGLNTVVPYGDDAYYQARPKLGIERDALLRLDEHFGLHPRLLGLRNLWEKQQLAIVHGCGYPNPTRSHFSAMAWWHSGVPHGAEPLGWLGRSADARWPDGRRNSIVNIAQRESLAVRSARHAPIVFADPKSFVRVGDRSSDPVYRRITHRPQDPDAAPRLAFLRDIARTADKSSSQVREATSSYETPVSYGSAAAGLGNDLRKVAALMAADFPARIYYVSMGGFDTHGSQAPTQQNLLMYLGDALEGFLADADRLGRGDDVAVLVFTEFGRRVAENRSGGTDHGTATPMWLLGRGVTPGFHGTAPSLDDLDEGDLIMTTDFRRVYASVLSEWMGIAQPATVLGGDFEPMGLLSRGGTAAG
jgi:uncharacterized protein (DUF1501 family)